MLLGESNGKKKASSTATNGFSDDGIVKNEDEEEGDSPAALRDELRGLDPGNTLKHRRRLSRAAPRVAQIASVETSSRRCRRAFLITEEGHPLHARVRLAS